MIKIQNVFDRIWKNMIMISFENFDRDHDRNRKNLINTEELMKKPNEFIN